MSSAPSLGINLINEDLFVNGPPHDIWRRLRREAPVSWNEGNAYFPGFWNITKYEDVMAISRDPAGFLSGQGIHLSLHPERQDPSNGRMMITTDPPRHVRLRRLVNKGFTPRAVAAWEPHVRAIVKEILDEVEPKGQCDFVVDIAAKLPLAIICEMMGVPRQDWDLMFRLTNQTLGASDPEYQVQGNADTTGALASFEMFSYFSQMILRRRAGAGSGHDLLAVLLDADIDGEKLTDEEVLFFCFLLIVAGNETTRNATSGGMLALMNHPEQRAKLLARPELLPTAIEEILRWVSPVTHMARLATRDVEMRGVTIKAGDKVVMWYPAVNRDEDIFPNPDVFDIERTPNDHLAFGIGEHFCLGAGFARLELRVMFEELFRRLPAMEPAGPTEYLRSNFIGGIKHVPVRW